MFFSPELLSKKGPLGLVWKAAHSRAGPSRREMLHTSLLQQVEQVSQLEMAMLALPLRAKLLLGCSRMYMRSNELLLHDVSNVLESIRSAFHPGQPKRSRAFHNDVNDDEEGEEEGVHSERNMSKKRKADHIASEHAITLQGDTSSLQQLLYDRFAPALHCPCTSPQRCFYHFLCFASTSALHLNFSFASSSFWILHVCV